MAEVAHIFTRFAGRKSDEMATDARSMFDTSLKHKMRQLAVNQANDLQVQHNARDERTYTVVSALTLSTSTSCALLAATLLVSYTRRSATSTGFPSVADSPTSSLSHQPVKQTDNRSVSRRDRKTEPANPWAILGLRTVRRRCSAA